MISIENLFPGLVFDEIPHKYYVEGEEYPSVSKLVKKFCNEFDKDLHFKIAKGDVKKALDLKNQWLTENKKATTNGTKTHLFLENVANIMIENQNEEVYCKMKNGLRFLLDLPSHIKIVTTEVQMYNKAYKFCGTSDLLLYNTITNKFIIADYKTNKKEKLMVAFKNQKMLHPFDDFIDSAFNHYILQLSLYQIMLEKAGLEIEERWLIWLLEDEYQIHKLPDITTRLINYLENDK